MFTGSKNKLQRAKDKTKRKTDETTKIFFKPENPNEQIDQGLQAELELLKMANTAQHSHRNGTMSINLDKTEPPELRLPVVCPLCSSLNNSMYFELYAGNMHVGTRSSCSVWEQAGCWPNARAYE